MLLRESDFCKYCLRWITGRLHAWLCMNILLSWWNETLFLNDTWARLYWDGKVWLTSNMLLPEENRWAFICSNRRYNLIQEQPAKQTSLHAHVFFWALRSANTLQERNRLHFWSSSPPHHVEQEHLFSFRHCKWLKKCHERYETNWCYSPQIL